MSSDYISNIENRFETGIGPMTDRVLNMIVDRLTSGNFKEILTDKIVDPITTVVNDKIRPYIYISIILYLILVGLLLVIIYLQVKKK